MNNPNQPLEALSPENLKLYYKTGIYNSDNVRIELPSKTNRISFRIGDYDLSDPYTQKQYDVLEDA